MKENDLIPHLFRTEFGKITAVISRLMGVEHLEVAEDIASETFLSALETWSYKGTPPNPVAWLYIVAKNKARNYLQRSDLFNNKIAPEFNSLPETGESFEIDLSEQNITDSQLQMLFAICHPAILAEAQIGLALRFLCGFGIDEIASAFLTNKETINKRLFRAKEKMRTQQIKIEFPPAEEVNNRLNAVLTTLCLLYNEGYYSETDNNILREDLCLEAMRLTYLLLENPSTNQPQVKALFALMCFHTSRFPARKDKNGQIVLYEDQDESLWNREMISKGAYYLHLSSVGTEFSKYHIQASIAWWNTQKTDSTEKWGNILQLYNRLLQLEYSPIAALNRTYALAKVKGNEVAIVEAEKLQLLQNHYYFSLLGELYTGLDNIEAKLNFEKALALAKTNTDKQLIKNKLSKLF